jgi:hypothetical protein
LEPVNPDAGKEAFVNGGVTVRAITDDENAVKAVTYSLGKTDITAGTYVAATAFNAKYAAKNVRVGASLYSLTMTFDDTISSFIKPAPDLTYVSSVSQGIAGRPDIYELPLSIKIEDVAGNISVVNHILWLDPNGDLPTVVISYPIKDSVVGGEVRVYGPAKDNDWVHDVVIRVMDITAGLPGTPIMMTGAAMDGPTNTARGETGWMQAALSSAPGSNTNWFFNINSNGELNPSAGQTERKVQIEALAYDATLDHSGRRQYGLMNSVIVVFQNGVPEISGITIQNSFLGAVAFDTAPKIAGSFTLTALIKDETGLGSIKWRGEESGVFAEILGTTGFAGAKPLNLAGPGESLTTLTAGKEYIIYDPNPAFTAFGVSPGNAGKPNFKFTANSTGTLTGGKAIAQSGSGFFEYTLSITLDSAAIWNNKFAGKSGTYTMYLQAQDLTTPNPFQAAATLNLQIDNFYPLGAYEGDGNAMGTNYNIQGTAWDTGSNAPVQGIGKVVAYFSRVNGGTRTYIPPQELTRQSNGTYTPSGKTFAGTTIAAMKGRINDTSGKLTTGITFPANNDSGITIDRNDPNDTVDHDGYPEGFADNGPNKEWYATFNTLQLKDGPVTLHYVVFDTAGNASYYEHELVIKNHPPVIQGITLGTDLAGLGSINGETKTVSINYPAAQFTVRNNRVSFGVQVNDGNAPVRYRLQYVNTTTEKKAAELEAGKVYTIKDLGVTNWTSVGAPENYAVGTPFMATGNTGFGGGTVWAYSGPDGLKREGQVNSGTVTLSYSGSDFGAAADTIVDTTADNGAHFILKIYDTLIPGGGEEEQLADFAFIGLNVKNIDTGKPDIYFYDLNPLSAGSLSAAAPTAIGRNRDLGGIYTTGSGKNARRSGHIEPREGNKIGYAASNSTRSYFLQTGESNFARDTLSGKVILRGYAFDDQRIQKISLKIGNDPVFDILRADPSNGLLKAAAGIEAYVFNRLDLAGHAAEWAYVWDTETKPANLVVGDDVTVTVTVEDFRSPAAGGPNTNPAVEQGDGGGATSNRFYSQFAADLRPYITGIERDAAMGYASLRSRHGWYTFSRGETIRVNGFNLKDSGNTLIILKTMTNGGISSTIQVTGTGTSKTIKFIVPNDAASGSLILKAKGGSVEAVNNLNNDAHPWTAETFTNEPGNALWNDTRNVHIWQSDDTQSASNNGYFTGSSRPIDPSMTIDPANAKLYGAWADFNDQAVRYSQNEFVGNPALILDNSGGGGQDHTDIYMAKNRRAINPSPPAVVYHNTYLYGGGWGTDNSGGVYIHDPNGVKPFTSYAYSEGVYPGELTYHNKVIDQFTNVRIVTDGNDIHVSYYDTLTHSMKYWWGLSGIAISKHNYSNNTTSSNIIGRKWINIDGGYDAEDDFSRRGRPDTNGLARSVRAGEWSAIDLRSDKKPVIAYFDDEHQTVRLAWSSAVNAGRYRADGTSNPTSGTIAYPYSANSAAGGEKWTAQYVMDPSDPNYQFSGNYISMRINPDNNDAHLAFLNTRDSTLVYLKLTWNGNGYNTGTSVVVDELGEGAAWIDLSLDQQKRPWISYLKDKKNFYDVMKMAYLDPIFTNEWETMSVPARYYALDNRTSIENWPSRDTSDTDLSTNRRFWGAAIGYKSSDYYRIVYYTKPTN